MSTPTEAHRSIVRAFLRSQYWGTAIEESAAQLIADSEARAVASLKELLALYLKKAEMHCQAYKEVVAECDRLRATLNDPQRLHAHCVRHLTDAQVAHLFGERKTAIQNEREQLRAEVSALQDAGRKAIETMGKDQQCIRDLLTEVDRLRRAYVRPDDIRAQLEEAQAELAKERARLDWLAQNTRVFEANTKRHGVEVYLNNATSFRDAIDATRKAAP